MVLKPQNLLERLCLLSDSPPAQGHPSIPDLMMKAYEPDPLPRTTLEALQMNSGLWEITIAECIEEEGRVRYRGNIYLPTADELCLRGIQDHHDTALAGHLGRPMIFDLLDRKYYWKDMLKDVDQYVANCHSCRRLRSSQHLKFQVLRPLPVPEKPWEDISIDFVVGVPECEWFDAMWVVVDRLSKMRHFIPCRTTIDALGSAELIWKEEVCLPGLPLTIISDRGPKFASTFSQQVCKRLGLIKGGRRCPSTHRSANRMNEPKYGAVPPSVC